MRRLYPFTPYFLIAVCLGFVFFALTKLVVYRVGDGNEYYALYYAWVDTLRPWMSPVSFESFQRLVDRHEIGGLVSAEQLAAAFPALRVGETADFNHFWFYSFLAFSLSALLQAIGVSLQVHQSFLLLHYTLLLCLFIAVFRMYRWKGLSAAVIMTLLSPMLWYMDKVHAELFTFVFTLLAVAFVYRQLYLAGALCLAMASTQNPSFALIAFIPFFYRVVMLRGKSLGALEVILAISTALLVLLHPTYYFFRYGVPTPQLLAGGASLGGNLSTFYIWLFDPDLGLLPYWPLGVVAILLSFFISCTQKEQVESRARKGRVFFCFFVVAFFAINFYAHSSTTNLNSGASPGPARYSLWYLPVFFPVMLYVLGGLAGRKVLISIWSISLVLSAWLSVRINDPREFEKVAVPSFFSSFIQTNFSFLYSPPHEVFAEKYSGFSEGVFLINPRGVLGPDCTKMLLYPGGDRFHVTAPVKCFLDSSRLKVIADDIVRERSGIYPFYVWLDKEKLSGAMLQLSPGEYLVGKNRNGNFIMASGWGGAEDTAIWSEGDKAQLSLPCNERQYYFGRDVLNLTLVVQPFGMQDLTVKHQGKVLYRGSSEAQGEINIDLKPGLCKTASLDLDIYISDPRSPYELGQSNDTRRLGVALIKYSIN